MNDESKCILITGASSGLGEALARVLAKQRHRLGLVSSAEKWPSDWRLLRRELARRIWADVEPIVADLSLETTPAAVVAAMTARFGTIDVLINNAGIGLPEFFGGADPARLRQQIAVNLSAPLLLTRHALPLLLSVRGTVVNIGSATTNAANPVFGVYGATKAGLLYWNDALRREFRSRGLHVCYVDLGPVDTGFFEAVERLVTDDVPLGTQPTHDGLYNPVRDRPPRFMTASAAEAARRIARLVAHPRRRLTLLKRVVWPMRVVRVVFDLVPGLADLAISSSIRRIERAHAGSSRSRRRVFGSSIRSRIADGQEPRSEPASAGNRVIHAVFGG